jgi:hypothetical protein
MAFLAALPLIGKIVAPLLGKAFDVVDQLVPDKDLATKIKAQIQAKSMDIDHSEFVTALTEQSSVIKAEAAGAGWLQRNWRPGIMAIFGLIIFNNYVLNPWLSALFGIDVMMDIPPEMWSLLKLGIGGYIAGRSVEKIAPGISGAVTNMFKKKL